MGLPPEQCLARAKCGRPLGAGEQGEVYRHVWSMLRDPQRAHAHRVLTLTAVLLAAIVGPVQICYGAPQRVAFTGVLSEHKWVLKDLNPALPSDWSGFSFLILEMRASTPQRFVLSVYTTAGPRSIVVQPF